MKFNYNLTEDDFIKYNLFHVKNSESALKSLKMQRFLTPVLYAIIAYVLSSFADIPFLYAFIPFLIVSILWVVFYPKYFYNRITRHTKKMVTEGKNEGLLGKHSMNLTEEGIVDSTSSGETKVHWSGIEKFKEDDSNLFLYNSSISAYIIPKRDLTDLEEVRTYLKTKLTHLEL
jgi:hypothetical protein